MNSINSTKSTKQWKSITIVKPIDVNRMIKKIEEIIQKEDVETPPSLITINGIKKLIPKLIKEPDAILAISDGGICLMFKAKQKNKLIYLEYYNDGEIGLISENIIEKQIIENIDLTEDNVVEVFNKVINKEKNEKGLL